MGTTRTDGEKVELHQEVNNLPIFVPTSLLSFFNIFLGGNQFGDSPNLPYLNDGQTHNHGSVAARCG